MTNIFYIMATGPSVNDITSEEWNYLKDKHTLGFARFPFSNKKLEYYVSTESYFIDEQNLDLMAENNHLDTIILTYHPDTIKYAISKGFKEIMIIRKGSALFLPSRSGWFMDENNPPHKFSESRAHTFEDTLFRFRGQLSSSINCALVLGATEIRLIGVDLNCQDNFFDTDTDRWIKSDMSKGIYNERCKYFNTRMEDLKRKKPESWEEYNSSTMHTTSLPYMDKSRWGLRKLRGMIDVLDWMDDELREEGLSGIYTTSKKSALYQQRKLEYKSIMGD